MNYLKKMKGSFPLKRLIIYLFILSILPLVCIEFVFAGKKNEWEGILQQVHAVKQLSEIKARKQHFNHLARLHYGENDHFYLDSQLESLTFLKKEVSALEKLIRNPNFTGNEAAEKRFAFITGDTNRLHFAEGSVQACDKVQETVAVLSHPVEVDVQDVKEILNRIEGQRKGKPLLLITDFKLHKKTCPSGSEVLELNMKLLKREFVQ